MYFLKEATSADRDPLSKCAMQPLIRFYTCTPVTSPEAWSYPALGPLSNSATSPLSSSLSHLAEEGLPIPWRYPPCLSFPNLLGCSDSSLCLLQALSIPTAQPKREIDERASRRHTRPFSFPAY